MVGPKSFPARLYGYIFQQFKIKSKHELKGSGQRVDVAKLRQQAAYTTRRFLKIKLQKQGYLIKSKKVYGSKERISIREVIENAPFDPHFHFNSVLTDDKLRMLLPNFNLIYRRTYCNLSKSEKSNLARKRFEEQYLTNETTPMFTEAQYSHSGFGKVGGKQYVTLGTASKGNPSFMLLKKGHKGCDVCGSEGLYISGSLDTYFKNLLNQDCFARVHMGETFNPSIGRRNVDVLLEDFERFCRDNRVSMKPLRIGHGTHASFDAMNIIAKKGFFIEACLSSNKETGVIPLRSDYPLGPMLLLGINVVIATDGGDTYSTDFHKEYVHAIHNVNKFCQRIKLAAMERVTLLNGDILKGKHIIAAAKQRPEMLKKGVDISDEMVITYKWLYENLEENFWKGIFKNGACEKLFANSQKMLQTFYPNYWESCSVNAY